VSDDLLYTEYAMCWCRALWWGDIKAEQRLGRQDRSSLGVCAEWCRDGCLEHHEGNFLWYLPVYCSIDCEYDDNGLLGWESGATGKDQGGPSCVARPQGKKRVSVRYYYEACTAIICTIFVVIWYFMCRLGWSWVGCSRPCFCEWVGGTRNEP